ncbi:hypothetical protein KIN20_007228 [Parelaphostrongylus tenuis]|uniref:Uncharacterized protein n=1 Tax=Parelaphostrongylus tenuis TaxID=148309 RepID=A0AAD5QLV1_PARTN|nr:hypothetical protein KIN20_007228 [Parelaphostrongylus tenuis]
MARDILRTHERDDNGQRLAPLFAIAFMSEVTDGEGKSRLNGFHIGALVIDDTRIVRFCQALYFLYVPNDRT